MTQIPVSAAEYISYLNEGTTLPSFPGDVYVLSDTAANIATIPANLLVYAPSLVAGIVVTQGSLRVDLAQIQAIQKDDLPLTLPTGATVIVADTALMLDNLTSANLGQLAAISVTQISATDTRLQLTPLQDDTLASAGIGITESPSRTLTVTQLLANEANPGSSTFQAGQTYGLNDTAAAIQALTPAQIAAIPAQVTVIQANDQSVILTVAQALALEAGTLTVAAPQHDSVTVVDTAANLEALSRDQLQSLWAIGVSAVAASDTLPVFSAAQMDALGTALVGVTTPPNDPTQNDGTTVIAGPAGDGMTFDITWGSSVASAPVAFRTDVEEAFQFYADTFNDPDTLYYNVGFGGLGPGDLGASSTYFTAIPYAAFLSDLDADAQSSAQQQAVASVPENSPFGTATLDVNDPEAQALGLLPADATSATAVDGSIGFSDTAYFDYDSNPDQTPPAGAYDFLGAVEHEISEVMGRTSGLNPGDAASDGATTDYNPMDLFRFAAPGQPQLSPDGSPSYFSIDGGTTNLGPSIDGQAPVGWNNLKTGNNGDLGDWDGYQDASYTPDSYNDNSNPGVVNPISAADVTLDNVLGYDLATPTQTVTLPPLAKLLFFDGVDTAGNDALFVSDGTAAGTQELVGVNGIGGDVVTATSITAYGTTILFNGADLHGNTGLWVSDGSVSGTKEIAGIADAATAAQGGLAPTDLTVVGSKVLFDGTDASGSVGVWETDGTAAGTKELLPGVDATDITALPDGSFAFIGANGGVWESNGTPGGTTEVDDLTPGVSEGNFSVANVTEQVSAYVPAGGAQAYDLYAAPDGQLFFGGAVTYQIPEGATVTTEGLYTMGQLLSLAAPGPGGFYDENGNVYYDGVSPGISVLEDGQVLGTGGGAVWETDGSVSGTVDADDGVYDPVSITSVDGYLIYAGQAQYGDVALPVPGDYPNNGNFVATQGVELFLAPSFVTGTTVFDGGTYPNNDSGLDISSGIYYAYPVGDVNGEPAFSSDLFSAAPTSTTGLGFNVSDLTTFDGNVYFSGLNAAGQQELWELLPNTGPEGTNPFFTPSQTTATVGGLAVQGAFLTAGGLELSGIAGASPSGLDPTNITGVYVPRPTAVAITVGQLLVDLAMDEIDPGSGDAPAGDAYAVTDTAFDLESLTAAEITEGKAIGVQGLVSTDGPVMLTVVQAVALEDPVFVTIPPGDTVTIADSAADIAAMTATQLRDLPTIGVTAITATDASVVLTVAQAEALESPVAASGPAPAITVSAPAGNTVTVADAAATIAGLTTSQIAALASIGVTAVTVDLGAILDLTVAQATAFEAQGITVAKATIVDTAAAIESLGAGAILGLPALGVAVITATDAGVVLQPAQVQALLSAGVEVAVPFGDTVSVDETPSGLLALTPASISALPDDGIDAIIVTATNSPLLNLSVAQAVALEAAGVTLTEPGDSLRLQIFDAAAQLATLTGSQIAGLIAIAPSAGFIVIMSQDSPVTLTVDQYLALLDNPVGLSVPAGGTVTISGNATQIAALSPEQLQPGFENASAVFFDVTSGPLNLSLAQLQALEAADLLPAVQLPVGAMLDIADTASHIETFLASGAYQQAVEGGLLYQAESLGALIATDGPVTLTVQEAESLEDGVASYQGATGQPIPLLAPPGDAVTLADTAADIEGMSAAQLGVLSAYGISGITVTDQSLTLTVPQALALYDPVPITVPPGDTVIVADTEAEIDSLTPAELTGLASIGVTTVEVSNLTGAGPLSIVPGITLAISGPVPAAESITFTGLGAGGVLSLSDTADMAGTIYGFSPPDTIDLADLPIDSINGTASIQSGNVLQILENGVTYNLQLDPAQTFLTDENFALTSDAGTGSEVTVTEDPVTDYERVGEGQIVDGAVVANGGTVEVTGGGTFNRGTIDAGGTVIADYSAPAAVIGDVLIDSGLLDLTDGQPAGGTIAFGPVTDDIGGTLEIDDETMPSGTIVGMAPGDTIHLAYQFPYDATGTAVVASGNVLQVMEDGQTFDLQLDPIQDFTPDRFALADDLNGGTNVTEHVACFLPGTQIRTARGDVMVQDLAVGDTVVTRSGRRRPLCWIGKGSALAVRGKRSAATPLIVRKGALANNVPNCDLRITKGHSLYIDDVLIPVEFLVNHRSILWDDVTREVEVYHIELDEHDILIANGAAAESYRDDGNRWLFQNANSGWGLPPQNPCAPVLTGGPIVDAIWRRLLDRSGPRIPVPITDRPDLHLLVDGGRVDGRPRPNGVYEFHLPSVPGEVRIVSRAGAPDELGIARDPRLLGVAVRQIRLWRGAELRLIEASDPSLEEGFHLFEEDNGFRWTDGNALLPAALFDGINGACDLELHIGGTTRYPLCGEPVQVVAA
jgi:hypothetical protein